MSNHAQRPPVSYERPVGAQAQVDVMSDSRIAVRRRARRIANNGMAVAGAGSAGTTASTVLFAATANPLLAVGVGFALGVVVGMVVAKSAT